MFSKKKDLHFIFYIIISVVLFSFLFSNINYCSAKSTFSSQDSIIINLNKGWNYVSSNVIPENTYLPYIFEDIITSVVEIKTVVAGSNPAEYFVVYNSKTRTWYQDNYDYKLGYKIKVSDDVNLEILGQKVNGDNSNNEILLQPGYNCISYLSDEPKSVNEIFSDYNGAIEYIKDMYSFAMFYGTQYYGSLNEMNEGNAYILKLSENSTSFKMVYPVNENQLVPVSDINISSFPQGGQFVYYPFRFDLIANQGANELVDIIIDLDTNACQFVGSNSRFVFPNHIELESKILEDPLSFTFVCYEPGNYNFDFTVTGQESNNVFNESLSMSILPFGRNKDLIEESTTFNLEAGWNYFSINLIPKDNNISEIFSEIIPYLDEVKILDSSTPPLEYYSIYNSQTQSWTVKYFNYRFGYKVKVNKDVNLTVNGYKIYDQDSDNKILVWPGYNFISYLCDEPKNINEIFSDYNGTIEYVKSQTSFATAYGDQYFGSLTTMMPGEAYFIIVSDDVNYFYFEYPVDPVSVPLIDINLSVDDLEIEVNDYFNISITPNENVTELVDISIDLNTENCEFYGVPESRHSDHIDLYSQSISDILEFGFMCVDSDTYNFDFTITGLESNIVLNDSINVTVLPKLLK